MNILIPIQTQIYAFTPYSSSEEVTSEDKQTMVCLSSLKNWVS